MAMLLFMGGPQACFAQRPSAEETIAFINKKLVANTTLDVRKRVLVSQSFDANHKLYREDRVICSELDVTRMGFESKDSLFFIPCLGDAGSCVEREMLITGNSRPYPRISFILSNGAADLAAVKKAFLHLEQLIDNPKYKESVVFEQK